MSDDGQTEDTVVDNTVKSQGSALKALISFFTIWHMDITQEDMDSMERSFHLVPIVGLIFGLVIIVEMALLYQCYINIGYGTSFLGAVVILATVFIGSKFLHFDGLTDFGDGMIVSGDPEKHVRALKDTLVGAGGVGVALITILLAVSVYSSVSILALLVLAPLVEVLVKNAQVFAAAKGTAGPGMAGRQVACTDEKSMVRSVIITFIIGTVLCAASVLIAVLQNGYLEFDALFLSGFCALLVGIIVSSVAGVVMARIANRNFGMVNGDILGATNETSRVAIMFFMALIFVVV